MINRKSGYKAWHAEGARFYPEDINLRDIDLFEGEKVFKPGDQLLTMGSCFARNLRRFLEEKNRSASYIQVPSGLNNSFAVRQFIEWLVTGEVPHDAYNYDFNNDRKSLKDIKGVVVTLGLAEVWRERGGNVFWRGIPEGGFIPSLHECVVSSVQDNVDNLKRICELLPDKKIIFTLSPVPLKATFLDRPALISNCVSKSVLRVALEEFFRLEIPNTYYWPSYELFQCGMHTSLKTLGDKTIRDPNPKVVQIIIDKFIETFFES